MVGERVVCEEPGVTRDRLYTCAFWGNKELVHTDTGEGCGWLFISGCVALGKRLC